MDDPQGTAATHYVPVNNGNNAYVFCHLLPCLHQCVVGTILTNHILRVMQRDKIERYVSAKVCEKYNKTKIQRFGVDSVVNYELASEELKTF
jgi:hypothetical protein